MNTAGIIKLNKDFKVEYYDSDIKKLFKTLSDKDIFLIKEPLKKNLVINKIASLNFNLLGNGNAKKRTLNFTTKNNVNIKVIVKCLPIIVNETFKGMYLIFYFNYLTGVDEEINSKNLFWSFFHLSPFAVNVLYKNGKPIYCNQYFQEILEYSEEELCNMKFIEYTHPNDVKKSLELVNKILNGRKNKFKVEKRYITKSGKTIWCNTYVSKVEDERGNFICFISILENITDFKKIEENFKLNKQRILSFINNIKTAVVIHDANTKIIGSNIEAQKILGLSDEQLEGKTAFDSVWKFLRYDGSTMPPKEYPVNIVLTQKHPLINYTVGIRREGKKRPKWGLVCANPIFNHEGKIVYVIVTFMSVTKNKNYELKLEKSKERYKQLFENNLVGIYKSTFNGKILECNKSFADIMGYSSIKEILKKPAWDLYFSPEQRNNFIEKLKKQKTIFSNVMYMKKKNGKKVWILENVSLVGKKTIISSLIDITEHKKAEKEIIKTEKKYKALTSRLIRVKEEERIKISRELHDYLGQNLTALKLDVAWLIKKTLPKIKKDDKHNLTETSKSALNLIDNLIKSVRKIANDLRPFNIEELGLITVIENELSEIKKLTNIKCKFNTNIDSLNLNNIQLLNIFRIFQEALSNVIRHSKAKNINIKLYNYERNTILEIEDDGKGITKEKIDNKKSLGILGMQERASQIGGKIIISSSFKKGTKVILRLKNEIGKNN